MEVYKLTNKVNGRIYIGSTVKTSDRRFWGGHVSKAWRSEYFKNDLSTDLVQLGTNNFELEVLESIEGMNAQELLAAEEKWITKYLEEVGPSMMYNQAHSSEKQTRIEQMRSTAEAESLEEVVLIKDEITDGIAVACFYLVNDTQFSNKREVLDYLKNNYGMTITMPHLNMMTGNHVVNKSITSRYPNFRFIDKTYEGDIQYFYE